MARPLNKKLSKAVAEYEAGAGLNEVARKFKMDKGYLSKYFKRNGITNGKIPATLANKGQKQISKAIRDITGVTKRKEFDKASSVLEAEIENMGVNEAIEPIEAEPQQDIAQKITKLQDILKNTPSDTEPDTIEPDVIEPKQEVSVENAIDRIEHLDDMREINAEIIALIKKRNPHFAKGFQTLAAILIQKASEILQGSKVTTGDLNNIAKTISLLNDTLAVFPKVPSIAQQININQNARKTNNNNAGGGIKDYNLNIELIEVTSPNEQK